MKITVKKREWKNRSMDRLVKHGLTKDQALKDYMALHEIDYEVCSEIAADDELSYGEN